MNKKIFIIEDEEKIRLELSTFLNRYGYETSYSDDFENIVEIALKEKPHIILLDINLPYYDGYYICREIRKASNVPIIVVTSRNSEIDELMSMNLGADDFITKPYNTQILLARISSIIRRAYQNVESEVFEFRRLKYNMSTSEMEFDDKKIELTKNESRILATLIRNKEKIVSRNELMKALWQSDEFVDDNTLTVNINRLRKKLEEIGAKDYLQTKRGQGYILI
ncbi:MULTISPECIES: response regulator transcription factor [unclassified Clostridium]|uniref:response regulator transcription factor n=1 Tax=Clostridium TaxID=1485 RepID=UPI001C8B5B34|nr:MULTISPECIES: response regulator transcription factor [unclassified Clostridium]MBX9138316.1 response regulator transcription factor [Clostridium sp. K12(2020)]MBX9145024.1 response regulator transcription factor [Clostridium sp. K13]MDU2292104.1 response regulator transcription factor [Clostridium celatum]MDU4324889.1 response regulator transcription factor [Clostridium celatum]